MQSTGPQLRNSNIELLRIVAMFFIVAHHAVWNSGVTDVYDWNALPARMQFLQLWSAWGKTGINVFVLISAYFMCASSLTLRRFMKVFLEAKFYAVVCYVVLLVGGYEVVTGKRLFMLAFSLIRDVNVGFTGTFLALYLLVPFLNSLVKALPRKSLLLLIGVLVVIYTGNATFFFHQEAYSELGWYVTLYFIGAYLRLYPLDWMKSRWVTGFGLLSSLFLACGAILAIDHSGLWHYVTPYYFTNNCQCLLSLTIAVLAVLWFANIDIGHRPIVNTVASCTFGIFLIHTASDAMRTWLWRDLFDMAGHATGPLCKVVFYFVAVNIVVFFACALIDLIRRCVVLLFSRSHSLKRLLDG